MQMMLLPANFAVLQTMNVIGKVHLITGIRTASYRRHLAGKGDALEV
jgi:hypothetical protein